MKIKRFLAPDMRTALQHVRQEHGPDAVILSNRVTPEGVEIVAASQYDEDLVRDVATPAPPVPPVPPAPAAPESAPVAGAATVNADDTTTADAPSLSRSVTASEDAMGMPESSVDVPVVIPVADSPPATQELDVPAEMPAVAAEPIPAPLPPAAVAADLTVEVSAPAPMLSEPDPVLTAPSAPEAPVASVAPWAGFQDELARMRLMLERGLNYMTDEVLGSSRARQQCVDWMRTHGFTSELIREVALNIPADSDPRKARRAGLALLAERLPLVTGNLLEAGGVMALVGPSGAGKTTMVGKLAAHYSARHGVRDIALVSLDNARPGGSERLYSLARQLGIVVHEADSQEALAALLQRLGDYRLVLIDSAGFAPNDARAAEQLGWLGAIESVRSLLVLPAHTQYVDLEAVVRRFEPAKVEGAILTKLDETSHIGNVLSLVMAQQLALSWVSDGQHLHDDLRWARDADLIARLDGMGGGAFEDAPYDPVAALVANHAFA